LNVFYAYLGD